MTQSLNYWYGIGGSQLDAYTPPTYTNSPDFIIPNVTLTYNSSGSQVTGQVIQPVISPGSYGGSVAGTSTFNDPDFVVNTNTSTFTINGLTPGAIYTLRIRAYTGANQTGQYGDYKYVTISSPKPSYSPSVTSTTSSTQTPPMSAWDLWWRAEHGLDTNNLSNLLEEGTDVSTATASSGSSYAVQGDREVQTSLFKITNNNTDKNKYSIATRATNISTGYSYYSFGTSLFFQSNVNDIKGSGGIGFFTDNQGMNGYYVIIQTVGNSSLNDKQVNIYKVISGRKIKLVDSQENSTNTLTGILGGLTYKVDINVKIEGNIRAIEVYVNNFKITAVDQSVSGSTDPDKAVLPVTGNVAMVASSGKVNFDYIYATPLTENQYKNGIIQNVYEGQYGTKTLSFLYGDRIVQTKPVSEAQVAFLDDFGKIAREIRQVKVKYQSRPGNPLFTSVGINKYANVMGERLTSFGAEIYVINNGGTYIPLDDSNLHSFSIIGNYIVTSGQHEYASNPVNENTVAEPVVFESSWIQSEIDAKNLADWIKTQWSKQQQIVNLETFGNPLISVGDLISINYPSNDFDGTEKFVVTRVNNSFDGGLQTSITARSIYS